MTPALRRMSDRQIAVALEDALPASTTADPLLCEAIYRLLRAGGKRMTDRQEQRTDAIARRVWRRARPGSTCQWVLRRRQKKLFT